jgi:flagellar hook-basal body complex protein FliE
VIRISPLPAISPVSTSREAQGPAETPEAFAKSFGQFLNEALSSVEQAQLEAADAARRLATGEIRDIAEVTIASEKATLALQLTVQVRNRVIEAYQDMMRMPV